MLKPTLKRNNHFLFSHGLMFPHDTIPHSGYTMQLAPILLVLSCSTEGRSHNGELMLIKKDIEICGACHQILLFFGSCAHKTILIIHLGFKINDHSICAMCYNSTAHEEQLSEEAICRQAPPLVELLPPNSLLAITKNKNVQVQKMQNQFPCYLQIQKTPNFFQTVLSSLPNSQFHSFTVFMETKNLVGPW